MTRHLAPLALVAALAAAGPPLLAAAAAADLPPPLPQTALVVPLADGQVAAYADSGALVTLTLARRAWKARGDVATFALDRRTGTGVLVLTTRRGDVRCVAQVTWRFGPACFARLEGCDLPGPDPGCT